MPVLRSGATTCLEVKKHSNKGDRILFHATYFLNCSVWCKPGKDVEDVYRTQLQSLSTLFAQYRGMMAPFTQDDMVESFLETVGYELKHFNSNSTTILEF